MYGTAVYWDGYGVFLVCCVKDGPYLWLDVRPVTGTKAFLLFGTIILIYDIGRIQILDGYAWIGLPWDGCGLLRRV